MGNMHSTSLGVLSWFAVFFLPFTLLFASPQMDEDYSLRRVAIGVMGLSQETVHGEAVAGAIAAWMETNTRFELIPDANQALRAGLSGVTGGIFVDEKVEVAPVETLLSSLGIYHLNAALLAGIKRAGEGYEVRLALITAKNHVLVGQASMPVEDPLLLESFSTATRIALGKMEKQIPFQSAVLNREGYRIVLDRGAGTFRLGQQVSAFTLESWRGNPIFEETGVMEITRVDKSLAFARLIADKRPKEIMAGNKVLFGEALQVATIQSSAEGGRGPASLLTHEGMGRRGGLGFVSLQLGPSLTQMNQSTSDGTLTSTGSTLYPGGKILGELLLTSHLFLDLGLQVSTGSVANTADTSSPSLGSSLSQMVAQVGYRLGNSRAHTTVDLKVGYAKQKFGIDIAPEPFQFVTRTYSSLWVGASARVPLADDFSLSLAANLPFFQTVAETPLTSGAEVAGSSGLEVQVKAAYMLNPQMDIDVQFGFESHASEFSGQGTKSTALLTSSETQKTLLAGLSYFF